MTIPKCIITRAVRHRVEVSPPFFFVFFFSGRSCSARALCECWAHVPKGSTSFPVPYARQGPNWRAGVTGVDVLCMFYFCTCMCSRFVQYIYTSLLLKWRSISQSPHSNGALFCRKLTRLTQRGKEFIYITERGKLFISHRSPIVAKQFFAQRGKQLNSPFTRQSN